MINAGERAIPIAAEQIKRPPASRLGAVSPALIEEVPAIVYKKPPTMQWHVAGWIGPVKPR